MQRCEHNSSETQADILEAAMADSSAGKHKRLVVRWGGTRWWLSCEACGASWSVTDSRTTMFGFEFMPFLAGYENCVPPKAGPLARLRRWLLGC
jgi:hypothetical protein